MEETECTRAVTISERELVMLLGGEAVATAAGKKVFCQDLEVGRCCENGFLETMKCQMRRHDEDKLAEYMDKWSPRVRDLYIRSVLEKPCPVCGGTEMIETKTREAKMLAMSALVFCRYGGIHLPAELCKQLIRSVA